MSPFENILQTAPQSTNSSISLNSQTNKYSFIKIIPTNLFLLLRTSLQPFPSNFHYSLIYKTIQFGVAINHFVPILLSLPYKL